jgi:hypothetical protein
LHSLVVGPLEAYAPGFAAQLERQGYTISTAYSPHLGGFCGWDGVGDELAGKFADLVRWASSLAW